MCNKRKPSSPFGVQPQSKEHPLSHSTSTYRDFGTPGAVVSQFFLGRTPADAAKAHSLAEAVELQVAAYTAAGAMDPVLGGYEALGRGFAEAFPSLARVETASTEFVASTYASIFGRGPTVAQQLHFEVQEAAMKALYIANGASEADALVSARGAVIGQMLGEAVKVGGNAYATGAANYLADSLDGQIDYGKPLGDYKPDTVEVPGPVVEVPVPGPVVDKPDATIKVYGDLDAKFTANGNLLFGDQTTPATGQNAVYDPVSGAMVSFSMMPRQTADGTQYRPTSAEFDGVTLKVAFNIPAGQQLLANGSFQDVANRGAGSTNFTVGANGGIKEFLQAGNKVELKIDQDKTAGEAHFVMNAVIAADGTIDFTRADGGPGGLLDNTGNALAFSNSTQQNFFLPGGVADLTAGSIFTNELNVYDAAGVKLIGVTETITLVGFNYAPADQLS
jgi:hypothetical protein